MLGFRLRMASPFSWSDEQTMTKSGMYPQNCALEQGRIDVVRGLVRDAGHFTCQRFPRPRHQTASAWDLGSRQSRARVDLSRSLGAFVPVVADVWLSPAAPSGIDSLPASDTACRGKCQLSRVLDLCMTVSHLRTKV